MDQLIQAARSHERRIDDVRSVRRANHEDVLLQPTPSISVNIWLITRSAAPPPLVRRAAALPRDGVQLVEEQDTRRAASSLLEDVSHVRLGLAEPHRE